MSKIKITGGEPLVRKNAIGLIRKLKKISGITSVTLTTNGVLLEQYYDELADAGIDAITISLDTIKGDVYQRLTRRNELERVLRGIEKAVRENKVRLKINCVCVTDIETQDILGLLNYARGADVDIRFIEMMPIGYGNIPQSISNEELKEKIMRYYGNLTEDFRIYGNGPAVYYSIEGFKGNIGFISAIHGKFCNLCNRIRMTSTGDIKPCLCYEQRWALKPALRMEHKEKRQESIQKILIESIKNKPQMHCFENVKSVSEKHFMGQIGG